MQTSVIRYAGICSLFLLVVISGFWLARIGKPYHQGIFTIHKLIALAGVVLATIWIVGEMRDGSISTIQWIWGIFTVLSVLLLFISGGLLSAVKDPPVFVLRIHQILPFLTIESILLLLYQFLKPSLV